MTVTIGDYQVVFQDYYSGDYITLGGGDNYCSVRFEGLGSPDMRAAEREVSGEDGITFGPEYLGMRKWTISGAVKSGINQYTPGSDADAWDAMSKLQRAWDQNPVRRTTRGVVPLYFKRPGRDTVLIYGRPDRIDPDTTSSHSGYIAYTGIYRQSDPLFYSETETSVMIQLSVPYSGGLLYTETQDALITPFVTTLPIYRIGAATQDGDTNAPLKLTFHGPVLNPELALLDDVGGTIWKLSLHMDLEESDVVVVDTNQWARSVLLNDVVGVAGALQGPRMSDITIPPGSSQFVYSGLDFTGTSTCEIRYRNAWASL